MENKTYSDHVVKILKELGYTHCFFVAGGNIMHLLNSAREQFVCIPFVHEVSAGIAAEYFTELSAGTSQKAFVMVTAGPGLTNLTTSIAGAWHESRELLVIAGQVKSTDLRSQQIRQRGIQEIDGVGLLRSLTKVSKRIVGPIDDQQFVDVIECGSRSRKGPVVFEICIDVQGKKYTKRDSIFYLSSTKQHPSGLSRKTRKVINSLRNSKRPIVLIGGGVSYEFMKNAQDEIERLGIPVMTTWNGADRVSSGRSNYLGRPNTWGQRSANVIIQQSDLIIAIGTSLGLQQTGFNWTEFGKNAKIIHVDIDKFQLNNFHPRKDIKINVDSEIFLNEFFKETKRQSIYFNFQDWMSFGKRVRNIIPLNDSKNITNLGYVKPYEFVMAQNQCIDEDAILIPSSSGGAETVTMQAFEPIGNQRILGNKSLASMGYGLAGALGASLAFPDKQIILNEGDGGFSQNLQDLGTVERNSCNIKMFIWSNNGYASIKMTQQNYFNGAWIGCDKQTGLGIPDWKKIANAYDIPFKFFNAGIIYDYPNELRKILSIKGPVLIEVPIDPNQTYYPKITSEVLENGTIISNPIHLMTPELNKDISESVFKFIK